MTDRPWKFGGVVQAVWPDVAGCRGVVAVDVSGDLVRSSEWVRDAANERRRGAPEYQANPRTPSGAGSSWACASFGFRVESTASAATTLRLCEPRC